jgi:alkaline phosphatase D
MSYADLFFAHGEASGEPMSDAVVIWTRVQEAADIDWDVSLDPEFEVITASGNYKAISENDFTVNIDVSGLKPYTLYYYRFRSGEHVSAVGRTKTLPILVEQSVRFAQVSCAKYNLIRQKTPQAVLAS